MSLRVIDKGCTYPDPSDLPVSQRKKSVSLKREFPSKIAQSLTFHFVNALLKGKESSVIDMNELYAWAIEESQKPEHFDFLAQFRPEDFNDAIDLIAIMLCTRNVYIRTESEILDIVPDAQKTTEAIHELVFPDRQVKEVVA